MELESMNQRLTTMLTFATLLLSACSPNADNIIAHFKATSGYTSDYEFSGYYSLVDDSEFADKIERQNYKLAAPTSFYLSMDGTIHQFPVQNLANEKDAHLYIAAKNLYEDLLKIRTPIWAKAVEDAKKMRGTINLMKEAEQEEINSLQAKVDDPNLDAAKKLVAKASLRDKKIQFEKMYGNTDDDFNNAVKIYRKEFEKIVKEGSQTTKEASQAMADANNKYDEYLRLAEKYNNATSRTRLKQLLSFASISDEDSSIHLKKGHTLRSVYLFTHPESGNSFISYAEVAGDDSPYTFGEIFRRNAVYKFVSDQGTDMDKVFSTIEESI